MRRPRIPKLLYHLAGSERPQTPAVVVHGVLGEASELRALARALVRYGSFDGVYAYDCWAYWGACHRGDALKTVDLLHVVQPGIRGFVLSLPRSAARKAAVLLQTPFHVVEGAAQALAAVVSLLEWRDVCLLGHDLGGLVVRCAVEAHPLRKSVGSVVTLATPHRLWQRYHHPEQWKPLPLGDMPYLAVVGEDDWVWSSPYFGDLSRSDARYDNVYKVVYPGYGHDTIHREAGRSWIPELVSTFHWDAGLRRRQDAYVVQEDDEPVLYLSECSGPPPRGASAPQHYAGWWMALSEEATER